MIRVVLIVSHSGAILIRAAADAGVNAQNSALERKSFIEGVAYLLRGLPLSLSAYETEQIRAALYINKTSNDITPVGSCTLPQVYRPRSLFRRIIQIIVTRLFVFVHFILPYFIILFHFAARLERRYKITEALLRHGVNVTNAIVKRCVYFASLVLNETNNTACQGIFGLFVWAVVEVARGITDGVIEGLTVVTSNRVNLSLHDRIALVLQSLLQPLYRLGRCH